LLVETASRPHTVPTREAARAGFRFPAVARWGLSGAETAMLAGVLVVTALVYVRCLTNWFFSDDVIMIEKNRYISEWSFLWKSMTRDLWWFNNPDLNHAATTTFYQPMQSLWLGLGYHLFGASPVGWHLAKIALHLLVVVLVSRVPKSVGGSPRVGLLAAFLLGLRAVPAGRGVGKPGVPNPFSPP